jgi:hypothetical protein
LKDNSNFVADGFPKFFYGKIVKDLVAIVTQHSEIIGLFQVSKDHVVVFPMFFFYIVLRDFISDKLFNAF